MVWLLGDIFNIIGAVAQGVLPTMIILAVYYTLADIILLLQCFYYRGFTLSDAPAKATRESDSAMAQARDADENTPLLARQDSPVRRPYTPGDVDRPRRRSSASFQAHLHAVDGIYMSPTTPLLVRPHPKTPPPKTSSSPVQSALFNLSALLLVCLAGVFGWWLSQRSSQLPFDGPSDRRRRHGGHHKHRDHGGKNPLWTFGEDAIVDELPFDVVGQIFGYLCALFYLGSRVPQLLLNFRRKSTEGVSMLFFLFACVGNLTYVLSICAYEPECARLEGSRGLSYECQDGQWETGYKRYIAVNASWLIGSAGTLLLDGMIFAQFWMYRGREAISAEGS